MDAEVRDSPRRMGRRVSCSMAEMAEAMVEEKVAPVLARPPKRA